MDTFITILMLILLLLVLIGFHELGHFCVAKMCHVYCAEFSLGFGPKLFSFKRKKGETYFTVRALPIGGYVSMYSDDEQLDEEEKETIPPERSLERQSWPKRLAIILAGVTVNFLLTFVFIYAYALCFPQYTVTEGNYWTYVVSGDQLETVSPVGLLHMAEESESPSFDPEVDHPIYKGIVLSRQSRPDEAQVGGYLIDTDTIITTAEGTYEAVTIFNPSTITSDSDFVNSLTFYTKISLEDARNRSDEYAPYGEWPDLLSLSDEYLDMLGISGYPDYSLNSISIGAGDQISFNLTTIEQNSLSTSEGTRSFYDASTCKAFAYEIKAQANPDQTVTLTTAGLRLYSEEYWMSAGERFSYGNQLWCNLWTSIGGGLYALFTGNFSSLSGPVGIGATMGTMASIGGWAYSFFFLGALVSLNLAIINLFPIPGLDGWAAVVTVYETLTKKKIKERTKNIVSYIGLGLVLLLAVVVLVMDIVRLF